MRVARCPKCQEEVTVPAGASSRAVVQCPWCREEYQLELALQSLPPQLVVLDDPEGAPAGSGAGVVSQEGVVAVDEVPPFQFDEAPAPSAPRRTASAAPSVRRRPQRRHSVMWEMVKVVAGGVVGIVIAIVILWWGVGKDPFRLGPTIAPYVPWVVPQRFRGGGAASSAEEQPREESLSASPQTAANQPAGGRRGSLLVDAESSPFARPFDSQSPRKPKRTKRGGGRQQPQPPADQPEEQSATDAEQLASGSSARPAQRTAQELKAAIDNYLGAARTWLQAGTVDDLPAAKENLAFYTSLATLAEVVGGVDPRDPQVQQYAASMERMLGNFGNDGARFAFVARAARWWLEHPERRSSKGVLLAGVVVDLAHDGRYYRSTLQLQGEPAVQIPVLGSLPPVPGYQPGGRALVLGVIVDNPADQLVGYQGSDEQVVLGKYVIPMPGRKTPPASGKPAAPPADVPASGVKPPPAAKQPAAAPPAEKEPKAEQPAAENPSTQKPAVQPVPIEKPAAEAPAAPKPTIVPALELLEPEPE